MASVRSTEPYRSPFSNYVQIFQNTGLLLVYIYIYRAGGIGIFNKLSSRANRRI